MMRLHLVGVVSVGLLAGLLGCAREREQTAIPNPRTLGFSQAGVSLVVGDEWQASDLTTPHNLKPPTLTGPAGVIRVILLPPDRTDPEVVASGLRSAFDADPRVAKHTFRRQKFVSKNGVQGICISYLQRTEKDGQVTEVQNHHFLVKNRAARCVVINYLATAGADFDPVTRTIRNTLALQ
jgi:hypothetical protein